MPGLFAASPIGTVLEEVSLRWLLDVLKLPADCGAVFVTGGTVANFTALAAARHRVLATRGMGRRGRRVVRRTADYRSGWRRGASVADQSARNARAWGDRRIKRVPVDRQGRMLATEMPPLNGPAIVCMQAGT